ncbi:MAG: hypothetical protein M3Z24_17570 [Chloroflexota bacterium]|nr:hypothetical protein [Chloroflexota bacterium]
MKRTPLCFVAKAAILAGLTLSYRTGPMEGDINRQVYGRAGLSTCNTASRRSAKAGV